MKTKALNKNLLTIFLIALTPLMGYASSVQLHATYDNNDESERIGLNTIEWNTKSGTRSISSPFTATIESDILTIQCEDVSCDLTISITDCNSGREVYVMEVLQEASNQIMIPVDGLSDRHYCLTISNPEMG